MRAISVFGAVVSIVGAVGCMNQLDPEVPDQNCVRQPDDGRMIAQTQIVATDATPENVRDTGQEQKSQRPGAEIESGREPRLRLEGEDNDARDVRQAPYCPPGTIPKIIVKE